MKQRKASGEKTPSVGMRGANCRADRPRRGELYRLEIAAGHKLWRDERVPEKRKSRKGSYKRKQREDFSRTAAQIVRQATEMVLAAADQTDPIENAAGKTALR